ncbi:MAG TPA: signal peptidase I [Patescibacteria group bacterium]|nr:signal peptidase I [Patescibacteria group bacterium]
MRNVIRPRLSLENKSSKSKIFYRLARFFDLSKWVILIAIVIYLGHLFVVSIFAVSGASMEPNFHDKEYLIVNKTFRIIDRIQRGDVAIFKFPGDPNELYIKRIIGLPGDTIEIKDKAVWVNGRKMIEMYLTKDMVTDKLSNQQKWHLGANEYFVMGDNRENSNDSRVWGSLPKENIVGIANFVILPAAMAGKIPIPDYYTSSK